MNQVPMASSKPHPFGDLLGIEVQSRQDGCCECSIKFDEKLLNPNDVLHGGVIYALADTGMGGAIHSMLSAGELCATIEIKITYLHAAGHHDLSCTARVLKKGRGIAMLEAEVFSNEKMVAKATGSFALFKARE